MATRSRYTGNGRLTFFDDVTGENELACAAVVFDDEFFGAGHLAVPTAATTGYAWIKKLQKTGGSPAVGALANGAAGLMQFYIDATSELQEASLTWSDQLTFDATKQLEFQVRLQLPVLPTGVAQIVIGLGSAYSSGPDTLAEYIRFGLRGNGTILAEVKDGINSPVSVSTGITIATTTEWHTLAISLVDPTNVKFTIDGNTVALAAIPFAATGTAAILQPFIGIYKASGVGVGTMNLDFVNVVTNRI